MPRSAIKRFHSFKVSFSLRQQGISRFFVANISPCRRNIGNNKMFLPLCRRLKQLFGCDRVSLSYKPASFMSNKGLATLFLRPAGAILREARRQRYLWGCLLDAAIRSQDDKVIR
jgi:hypothetical protein